MGKMMRTLIMLFLASGCMALSEPEGYCLESEALILLKQAGVSDETIQAIAQEKALETCALTVPEIISLKKAGLSEETIQLVVREGSFIQNRDPIVYGKEIKPISFTTVDDIVELKKAGLSDDALKALIIYGSEDRNDQERERAWEMLQNMGLIIDLRK